MPYHIGEKGSGGCSGFPVVEEGGKVVGCHPTKAEATNHLQALYVNVPDASKGLGIMNEEIIPTNADEVGCDCGECDKCMNMKYEFAGFAKDHSKTQQLTEIFKDI